MLKFFRRIRQQLLSGNQFGKYLLYALGEIVLVVIGILIALAINNSNQERLTAEKEQIYLNGLKSEFQTSKRKLTTLLQVNRDNYEGAKSIIAYTGGNAKPPTEKQFSELLYHTFSADISLNPNNSLLHEMINSGGIKDLANADLRVVLTNWVATLEDITKQEDELRTQREKVLDLFRTDEYSIRTILNETEVSKEIGTPPATDTISNLGLLKSVKFENNVLMFILTSYATEQAHYQPLLQDLNTILQLLETEIE